MAGQEAHSPDQELAESFHPSGRAELVHLVVPFARGLQRSVETGRGQLHRQSQTSCLESSKPLEVSRGLPNGLVQLQARYNHCDEAASEKCLSGATFVRRLEPKAKRDWDLRYVPMRYRNTLSGSWHFPGIAQILVDARFGK